MTGEEAIKNIKEHCYFANLVPPAKEALDMAIKALEQKSETVTEFADRCRECGGEYGKLLKQARWIPVSERLPEPNTAVLIYVNMGPSETFCLAYWNDVRGGWEEWIGIQMIEAEMGYEVLAWMPLPEPYGEKER